MDNLKFYKNDPLARFLIDKLHLTPLAFALIWTSIVLVVSGLTALISGKFISRAGQVGFLQDWVGWIWNLVFTPVLAGYYLWGANALSEVLQSLKLSDAVTISEADIEDIARDKKRNLYKYISVAIAVAAGVLFYAFPDKSRGFLSSALLSKIGITITFTIGAYTVSMLVFTLVSNIAVLRRVFYKRNIVLNPLHPDRCSGLKALGTYSLRIAYLVAAAGIIVGFSEYRIIVLGLSQQYWWSHAMAPLYIAIAFASFYAPLTTVHAGMKKAKEGLLKTIADQYLQDYQLSQLEVHKSAKLLDERIKKIQYLQTLYEITNSFPVWPLDTGTIRRFLAVVISPLLPAAIGLLVELLKRLML